MIFNMTRVEPGIMTMLDDKLKNVTNLCWDHRQDLFRYIGTFLNEDNDHLDGDDYARAIRWIVGVMDRAYQQARDSTPELFWDFTRELVMEPNILGPDAGSYTADLIEELSKDWKIHFFIDKRKNEIASAA